MSQKDNAVIMKAIGVVLSMALSVYVLRSHPSNCPGRPSSTFYSAHSIERLPRLDTWYYVWWIWHCWVRIGLLVDCSRNVRTVTSLPSCWRLVFRCWNNWAIWVRRRQISHDEYKLENSVYLYRTSPGFLTGTAKEKANQGNKNIENGCFQSE